MKLLARLSFLLLDGVQRMWDTENAVWKQRKKRRIEKWLAGAPFPSLGGELACLLAC